MEGGDGAGHGRHGLEHTCVMVVLLTEEEVHRALEDGVDNELGLARDAVV